MFKQDQKEIYRYHNGHTVCVTDPLEVQLKLEEFSPDWSKLFSAAQLNDLTAIQELIDLSRKMFKLPEAQYDEVTDTVVGLTSLGAIGVLMDFVVWSEDIKKKAEALPTSADATEPPSV